MDEIKAYLRLKGEYGTLYKSVLVLSVDNDGLIIDGVPRGDVTSLQYAVPVERDGRLEGLAGINTICQCNGTPADVIREFRKAFKQLEKELKASLARVPESPVQSRSFRKPSRALKR